MTNMDEPLARSIGTGLEIIAARDFLRGAARDARLQELTVRVAGHMLRSGGKQDGEQVALRAIESGDGYEKFVDMIEAQGGSRSGLESMRPAAQFCESQTSAAGYVIGIDAMRLGNMARHLSTQDRMAGLRTHVRVSDRVEEGTRLLIIYGSIEDANGIGEAFLIGDQAPRQQPLIYATVLSS